MKHPVLVACLTAFLVVAGLSGASAKTARYLGTPASLGDGSVAGYAELDDQGAPKAIGVVFAAAALATLPSVPSDGNHCIDANNDGTTDLATECAAWHERVLPLPSEAARRADMPFKWALLNWNPLGHMPPGVFDKPHFDVHFYIEPIESIFSIQRGPCGPEFVRCDQFAVARQPIPSNYLPASYMDLGIVAPAMGNHLIDPTNRNFAGEPFTRHWVYGAWAGRVVFYEEMLTLAYLQSKPSVCYPIPVAEAFAIAGWYPTQSCIRYRRDKDEYTVSLEKFVERKASPPGPLRQTPKLNP